jgi:radical SAM protein with 4Fe4S-binding SPASM domain
VPCCAKPFPNELNFGNAFEKPVMECLNSKKFQEFRELWFRNETPEFCKKCHFIDLKEFSL